MEVFSLLKYWRGSSGGNTTTTDANLRTTTTTDANLRTTTTTTTTIRHVANDDDDGPFFDLEFTLPADDVREQESDVSSETEEEEEVEEGEGEDEFNFAVSPSSLENRTDSNNNTLSPSDDLFFKGGFVPLEPSELLFNSTESHSKLSFLKPATKLRVLMLGFKKPKSTSVETNGATATTTTTRAAAPKQQSNKSSFTVKFKVEEVPIVSLFTRDSSSRNAANKQQSSSDEEVIVSEEKKFGKDVMQKYLKMVKPLYFRVSKRYGEKLGFSGQLSLGSSVKSTTETAISSPNQKDEETEMKGSNNGGNKSQKQGNLTAGLRVVRKHLGKSRSASSAVAAIPSSTMATIQSRRHDDSLLQQQDGIQSAILHCKRSFTASRDSDSSSSSSSSSTTLMRSTSDPSHAIDSSKTSLDEAIIKF